MRWLYPGVTSPLGRWLAFYLWDFKLTRAGKYLVAGGIVAGVFAMSSLTVPIYNILCTLFMLGFVSLIVNACHRPRLRLSGALPEKTIAGREIQGSATVTNTGRLPAYDVSTSFMRLPPSLKEGAPLPHAAVIPSGTSLTVPVKVKALKRGMYSLPALRAFTTFPFNLLRSGSARTRMGTLLVQPAFTSATGINVPVSRRYQPGGIALTSHLGDSPEYVGNREYRPGDPMRRIDARAWARLAKPVVREYQEEYFCRLALVLDTYVPRARLSRAEGFADLEAAISLAASVADALSRGEYIIDIFAAGPELYVFRTGRHTAHFDNVLEILACIDACRTNPFDTVAPPLADELHNISTMVCVFLDWDQSRKELVRMASELGCRVKVLIVRDGPTTDPVESHEADLLDVHTLDAVRSGEFDIL